MEKRQYNVIKEISNYEKLTEEENMGLLPEDLSESLLKELECPVCMEYMVPPITLCENGHNICNKCKPMMKKCPFCRCALLPTHNMSLENMTRRLLYPCCNQKTGCEEFYPLKLITQHQNMCTYRYYECPLVKAPGIFCLWEGPRSDISAHIDKHHKDRITNAITKLSVFIRDFQPTYKYCRIIYALGEIFYQQFHVKDGNFFFIVQYVGPEQTAGGYSYKVSFKGPSSIEEIVITQITQSIKVNIKSICESGKCIKLHYDIFKRFLHEGANLRFEMEISSVDYLQ